MDIKDQANELSNLMQSLSDKFYKQEQDQLCCYDLSASECRSLSYLMRNAERDVTMNELADQLNVTRSGATRITNKLYEKGYVLRKTHPDDGRACCVVPTPLGIQLCTKIESEAEEMHELILKKIDPAMRHVVLLSLQALEAAYKQIYAKN